MYDKIHYKLKKKKRKNENNNNKKLDGLGREVRGGDQDGEHM